MNRLWVRLTLAFLLVALVAVGVVAALSLQTTGAQFRQYVGRSHMLSGNTIQALTDYYATRGSWEGVGPLLAELSQSSGMGMMGRGRRGWVFHLVLADVEGRVVADTTGEAVGDRLAGSVLMQGVPLLVDGTPVGTLLDVRPADLVLDTQEQSFLEEVRSSLVLAGLLAAGLALLLGIVISRWLAAPVRSLKDAAVAIAGGNLKERVAVDGSEEIRELGGAFNQMAASLEEAEAQRRNMMADVAHELRTPLTVIQGNLQAMLDGVYPRDEAQVASLYDETRLLTRLVDDLRELALAEAGQLRLEKAPLDLVALAQDAVATFSPSAETHAIGLRFETQITDAPVIGDKDRLAQVLRNLLSNALRHTPSGGTICVRMDSGSDIVQVDVADTGSGIAAEDLPHVFDRFYKGDKSRSRRSGGAGLGLAIARQLVVAHGGELSVTSTPGQGAVFTMRLPMPERRAS